MPGKRKKTKRSIGFYWEPDDIELLRKGAEQMGLDMSSYVKLLIHAQCDAHANRMTFPQYVEALKKKARNAGMNFIEFVNAAFSGEKKGKTE